MILNPEAESKTRTRRENQGGEVALKKSSTQNQWDESALKKCALKTGELPGDKVALKKSCTKNWAGNGGGSVALKKSGTKNRVETGESPLALKNFGTKTEGEEPGKRFGTQKNWHSISIVGTVQIRAGQFALKDFRTKGNRRAVGTGVFSLNFFLTQTAKTLN